MVLKYESTAPYHSVQQALRVLETISRYGTGVTDTQIAREAKISDAQLTPLLRMLRRERYVEQVTDGAYVTGDSFGALGSTDGHDQALRDQLQQTLDKLRDSVGAAIYVSRYVDGEIRITNVADSPHTPRVNEWVDFRSAAHASAIGKSLLTQLDLNGRRDHLSRHRPARLTSRTITSERALFTRLDAQAPTVPMLDIQEYAVGTVCAAVPITAGASVGCLALSLPVEHAHRLRDAADTLNRGAAPVLLSLAL